MRGGGSDDDSDELDEFEESMDDRQRRPPAKNHSVQNRHYDEEYEVSQDLSVAESFDGRDKVSRNIDFVEYYFLTVYRSMPSVLNLITPKKRNL